MAEALPDCVPFRIRDVDNARGTEVSKAYSGDLDRMVRVGEPNMVMPREYMQHALTYHNFPVRPNDVFITGFPCSGVVNLAWLLLHYLNIEDARKERLLVARVPLLESKALVSENLLAMANQSLSGGLSIHSFLSSLEILRDMKDRRLIRSHLHVDFLPKDVLTAGCKIIHIIRHPKDVAVSLYNLHRRTRKFKAGLNTFVRLLTREMIPFSPYFQHGEQAWLLKDQGNVRVVFYETLVGDMEGVLEGLSRFLGVEVNEQRKADLKDTITMYNTFNAQDMKTPFYDAEADDDFVTAGEVGHWHNHFSGELHLLINSWIENRLANITLEYPYEV